MAGHTALAGERRSDCSREEEARDVHWLDTADPEPVDPRQVDHRLGSVEPLHVHVPPLACVRCLPPSYALSTPFGSP